MAYNNDLDLQGLLHEVRDLLVKRKDLPTAKPQLPATAGFKAPIKGTYYNSGVDLRASGGTTIYSIGPGIVTAVGTDAKGGNVITIAHPQAVKSYYAHLGTIKAHKGDRVSNNTPIATIGNSGNAKGTFPHLHIQTWKDGQLVDPGTLFHVPQYSKVDSTKEKVWMSDAAKMQATNFNMNAHKEQKFAYHEYGDLMALADMFDDLTKR
jgi:murein DD-endopeptidase MepM/ murein hydrolase activator NlpD